MHTSTIVRRIGVALAATVTAAGAQPTRPSLAPAHVDAIARLLQLEDTRTFDAPTLERLLGDAHPEVRRRATLAVGRIRDARGAALLRARPLERDTALAATTVFAVAQLKDTTTIAWLDSLLASPATPPTVATEAARGLGMLPSPRARAALAAYLARASESPRTRATIGEALLAIGRSTVRADLAPVLRWTASRDVETRWRAAWALFRSGDPAATAALVRLSTDPAPVVRTWAVRGLTSARADSAGLRAQALARLLAAMRDPHRDVRAFAGRPLASYGEPAAIAALTQAVTSSDPWIAGFMVELPPATVPPVLVPVLRAGLAEGRPCSVRNASQLVLAAVDSANLEASLAAVMSDPLPFCRSAALDRATARARTTALGPALRAAVAARLDDANAEVRRRAHVLHARNTVEESERRAAFVRALQGGGDAVGRSATLAAFATVADSADLPALLDLYDRARNDTLVDLPLAVATAVAAVQQRQGTGAAAFLARFAPPESPARRGVIERAFPQAFRWPGAPPRALADYRAMVERWVVPAYAGRPNPRARWETPRGTIDVALHAGDAPIAMSELARLTESGAIVGTEFIRVVPVFVAQQAGIAGAAQQREETNRHRLAAGHVAWANAGYDRGTPGYTLGVTPQPHNEGEFTALGRIVSGLDVLGRLQVGDRITAARMPR